MRALVIAVSIALSLSGCYESLRHVSQPDGTQVVERGTCAELAAGPPGVACADEHHLRGGRTAALVVGLVVGVAVVVVVGIVVIFAASGGGAGG